MPEAAMVTRCGWRNKYSGNGKRLTKRLADHAVRVEVNLPVIR